MNLIKSPYQILLERLGIGPAQQAITPQQMQAEMIQRGQTPQALMPQPQQPLYMAAGGRAQAEDDVVYDPVTGLPIYGAQTRDVQRGDIPASARTAENVLRGMATIPAGVGVGGTGTLASTLQMVGLPQFQRARKAMSQGIEQVSEPGQFVSELAGSMYGDPIGRYATYNMMTNPVTSTGYAALQGLMSPTEAEGMIGEPARERVQNAGLSAVTNLGLLGLLHSPKLLRLLKNRALQVKPE